MKIGDGRTLLVKVRDKYVTITGALTPFAQLASRWDPIIDRDACRRVCRRIVGARIVARYFVSTGGDE